MLANHRIEPLSNMHRLRSVDFGRKLEKRSSDIMMRRAASWARPTSRWLLSGARASTPATSNLRYFSRSRHVPGSPGDYDELDSGTLPPTPHHRQKSNSASPVPSEVPATPALPVLPPPPLAPLPPQPLMLDPQSTMDKLVGVASTRADRPSDEMMVSALLGGAYLSFGCSLFVMTAGGSLALKAAVPGIHSLVTSLVFPTGLTMIVLTGADLLTSNM